MSYIDFLKNRKFIEFMLYSTDELKEYWEKYINEHPDAKESFMLAQMHFADIKFMSYKIPQDKKDETILGLELESLHQIRKRKIKTFYGYAAAAVLGILLASTFFYNYYKVSPSQTNEMESYIVGNELESKDIQLITNNKTSIFKENIDISVTDDGRAKVKTNNNSDENIDVDNLSLNKLIVPFGKRSKLTLADGTRVWLNSGTVLEFPSKFKKDSRDIFLASGEIFIEAAIDKTKPLYVHTNEFDVKVYGTSFNISAYEDFSPYVVLVEGSVSLKTPEMNEERFITPSQQAILRSDGHFDTAVIDVDKYVSWRNGYLILDRAPLSDVLTYVERYYNLSIDFAHSKQLSDIACDGKLILSENVDNVMRTIAFITKSNFKRQDDKIYIFNNN